jgi:hypothetical protein
MPEVAQTPPKSKDHALKTSSAAIRVVGGRSVYSAIILGAAAIAVVPLLIKGPSCGDDFNFHLTSWLGALQSWRHGIAYPHWAMDANWEAGEPRFVFYPPLSWMLGAALGSILPWNLVPAALSFLMLAACGFGTRALGRSLLSEAQATLAGCLAIFSGYTLFCIYARNAFGELLGGFWIPLVLLLALRTRSQEGNVWQRALDGSAAPLSLAIAAGWLSNGPVGVIACYLLAAVTTLAAVLERSWAKIIRATIATALGIALAGFYLLPVARERSWVDLHAATDNDWVQIENNFVFAENPAMEQHEEHDRVNHQVSLIGVIMLTLTAGAILAAWVRYRLPKRQLWMPLAAIPPAVLFLVLPVSLPVWELLPLMRMLQFPWRWLLTLEAPMAIFLALAIWPDLTARKSRGTKRSAKARHGRWQLATAGILCGALFLAGIARGFTFFQTCTVKNNDVFAAILSDFASGTGVGGQLEYVPDGADRKLLAWGLPGACLTSEPFTELGREMVSPDKTVHVKMWRPTQHSCEADYAIRKGPARAGEEHYEVKAVLPHPGYLILRLWRYPAWQVSVNGRTVEKMPARDDGLMAVPAPAGSVIVNVDWTTTPDVIAGRWLSAIGALALAGIWFLERRQMQKALPAGS